MKPNPLSLLALVMLINTNLISVSSASVLSNGLKSLQQEYQSHQGGQGSAQFVSKDKAIQVINHDSVVIDLVILDGDAESLKTLLRDLGMTHIGHYKKMISGVLPIDRLGQLEAIPTSISIVRAGKPLVNQFISDLDGGFVYNQADAAMFTDVVRKKYNTDGSGIKVGVLSDSYNCLGGEALDIVTGDLPPDVEVLEEFPDCTLGTDEGRAMMQLIHDIAPGAKLLFHTAVTGKAGFAEGIRKLAGKGAHIIVDDIGYADELMFQDGIISQAINEVKEQGVAYFSSAGNSGRLSYEANFHSGIEPLSGDIAHNFNPSGTPDFYQKITIPEDALFRFILQWDNPAESAGGNSALSDLDVFLLDADQRRVLATGLARNIGHDPVEFLSFLNESGNDFGTEFNIYISHRTGPSPTFLKYIFFGGITAPWPEELPEDVPEDLPEEEAEEKPETMSIDEYATHSGTIIGHPNASGAIAVGAIPYQQTPWFNQSLSSAKIEFFSSAGGTSVFFDEDGDRQFQPVKRKKPDIVAPDGTNTSFFPAENAESDIDSDGFPNFFGTSAAAPHAAALAALVKSSVNGSYLEPDALYDFLRQGSLDLNDPFTPEIDNGYDHGTGFGLVQADLVFDAVNRAKDGLYLTLRTSEAQVLSGEEFQYQFDIVNHTDKTLKNLRLRALRLPRHVIYKSIDGCLSIDSAEVSCKLPDLPPGQNNYVSIVVLPTTVSSEHLIFEADLLTDTDVDLSHAHVGKETPLLIQKGDFNRDGCVDKTDFGILFSVFRNETGSDTEFDLTGDGIVDLDDLTEIENLYSRPGGESCF